MISFRKLWKKQIIAISLWSLKIPAHHCFGSQNTSKESSTFFTFVAHQACAYGSERPKWTALAVNRVEFHSVNLTCPGLSNTHRHKPWGLSAPNKFATAEETAYPPQLAAALARTFTLALASDGWKPPIATWAELKR